MPGTLAVGSELELELEQRAVGVGRGAQELMRSPLTGLWMICPARAISVLLEVAIW